MTNQSLTAIVSANVSVSALARALEIANERHREINRARLYALAREHGGDALMAEAMLCRLTMFLLLMKAAPELCAETSKLSYEELATILAGFPLTVHHGKLDFDGDDLAASIRLACEPVGRA